MLTSVAPLHGVILTGAKHSKIKNCLIKEPPLPLPLAESSSKLDTNMWQLCKEFLSFLKQEKKWWLIPLVLVLLMLAGLILFSGSSVLAPFMYPFM